MQFMQNLPLFQPKTKTHFQGSETLSIFSAFLCKASAGRRVVAHVRVPMFNTTQRGERFFFTQVFFLVGSSGWENCDSFFITSFKSSWGCPHGGWRSGEGGEDQLCLEEIGNKLGRRRVVSRRKESYS